MASNDSHFYKQQYSRMNELTRTFFLRAETGIPILKIIPILERIRVATIIIKRRLSTSSRWTSIGPKKELTFSRISHRLGAAVKLTSLIRRFFLYSKPEKLYFVKILHSTQSLTS